VIASILESRDE
jgi:hypothetical protein